MGTEVNTGKALRDIVKILTGILKQQRKINLKLAEIGEKLSEENYDT